MFHVTAAPTCMYLFKTQFLLSVLNKIPIKTTHTHTIKAHKNKGMINVLGERSLCNPYICLG